jgi:hypothetical protein
MTRALTLVRVYFVNALKAISNDINQRISAKVSLYSRQTDVGYE